MEKDSNKDSKCGKKKIIYMGVIPAALVIFLAIIISVSKKGAPAAENTADKKTNTEEAFSFKKEGYLSFLSAQGKVKSSIDTEIADSDDEYQMGLMYRTSLDEKQGMLFIFGTEEMHSFWMKNTYLPLDIIFVNAQKEIIKIHRNTVPFQEKPSYESGKPAMYVVEVNAGYCDKYDIIEGDKISFGRL